MMKSVASLAAVTTLIGVTVAQVPIAPCFFSYIYKDACAGVTLYFAPCGEGTCSDTIISNPPVRRISSTLIGGSEDWTTVNRQCVVNRNRCVGGWCIIILTDIYNNNSEVEAGAPCDAWL